MSDPIDRRESVRRGALAALALSLGIPVDALAEAGTGAARFQVKFWVEDRLTDTFDVSDLATRYLERRPTAVQLKWYDLVEDERRPRAVIGFTESRQMKVEFSA